MDPRQNRYTPETKLEAVLESFQRDTTIEETRKRYGLSKNAINEWRKFFNKHAVTIFQKDFIKKSKKKNQTEEPSIDELKKDNRTPYRSVGNSKKNEIFSKLSVADKVVYGEYIHNEYGYAKKDIAEALSFNRQSFYHKSTLETKDKQLVEKIKQWYKDDDTLGPKKLAKLIGIGKSRAKRVMGKYGIEPRKQGKKYKYGGKGNKTYPNTANDPEESSKYKDIFFSDMFETEIGESGSLTKLRGCFALRKSVRQICSLVFSYGMSALVVQETLKNIPKNYNIKVSVLKSGTYIWHSDQGKQYGAEETERLATGLGMNLSMSRAGTPTDNPFAERFVQTFKHAVCRRRQYYTLGEFLQAAEKWINFYNNHRPHESLNQVSPNDRAAQLGVEKVLRIRPFCV